MIFHNTLQCELLRFSSVFPWNFTDESNLLLISRTFRTVAWNVWHWWLLHDETATAKERTRLSVLQMWKVVLNSQHHAATYESWVRNGEEDSVQALLQEIPQKVESRAAHKENPSQTIQARSVERHQRRTSRRRRRRPWEWRARRACEVLRFLYADAKVYT